MAGDLWVFQQLGGDRKRLQLSGWQAPFGRPRQGTIVNAGITIRKQVTYYPGSKSPPTVHSFGKVGKPWELHGRWMDAGIALKDGAKAYARSWKDFIEDEQAVRASWGNILSYRVFIHELDLNFESEAHIAWAMKAEVLVDEAAPIQVEDLPVKHPAEIADLMQQDLALLEAPSFLGGSILDLLPEVADLIDSVVTLVNTPFAIVFDICSALSDFETAISSDLVKLGSGCNELRSAIGQLTDATDLLVARANLLATPTIDGPVFGPGEGIVAAADMISLAADKAQSDRAAANLAALIADMLNEIEKVQRGTAQTVYVARDGDTWESIATATMGGPDGAAALRDQNGIRFGQQPLPGKQYSVPASP